MAGCLGGKAQSSIMYTPCEEDSLRMKSGCRRVSAGCDACVMGGTRSSPSSSFSSAWWVQVFTVLSLEHRGYSSGCRHRAFEGLGLLSEDQVWQYICGVRSSGGIDLMPRSSPPIALHLATRYDMRREIETAAGSVVSCVSPRETQGRLRKE